MFYFIFIIFDIRNYIHILKNALFQNFETDQFFGDIENNENHRLSTTFLYFLVVNVLILSTLINFL